MPKGTKRNHNNNSKFNNLLHTHPLLSTANILSLLGVVIAVVYGWIGYNANRRMEEISKAQLNLSEKQDSTSIDLKHFVQLLGKTDTVINDLNDQLQLSTNQQNISNRNEQLRIKYSESQFYFATRRLIQTVWESDKYSEKKLKDWAVEEKFKYLNDIDIILESQVENPFLLANKYLFNDWISVRDSIWKYKFDSNFAEDKQVQHDGKCNQESYNEDQRIIAIHWKNCFSDIINLSQKVDEYMMYYRFGRGQRPTPKQYKRYSDILNQHSNKENYY